MTVCTSYVSISLLNCDTVIVFQHQLRLLEAQKRQQELILRRKTEEVSSRSTEYELYLYIMHAEIHVIHYICRNTRAVLLVITCRHVSVSVCRVCVR